MGRTDRANSGGEGEHVVPDSGQSEAESVPTVRDTEVRFVRADGNEAVVEQQTIMLLDA